MGCKHRDPMRNQPHRVCKILWCHYKPHKNLRITCRDHDLICNLKCLNTITIFARKHGLCNSVILATFANQKLLIRFIQIITQFVFLRSNLYLIVSQTSHGIYEIIESANGHQVPASRIHPAVSAIKAFLL